MPTRPGKRSKTKPKSKTTRPRASAVIAPTTDSGAKADKAVLQVTRIAKDLDLAYRGLLSGTPKHIAHARNIIDAYLEATSFWESMDFIDRIKDWINQEKSEVRDIKWLNDTYAAAKDTGDTLPDDKDARWIWKGRSARVLFYAGRYKRARKRFERSRNRVRPNFSKVHNAVNLPVAYDTRATEAEMLVYLGYPTQAIARLDEIPAANREGWHEWIRAWAWHQRGFVQRVPFGAFPGTDPTLPGPPPPIGTSWYIRSNSLLNALRSGNALSAKEKVDTYLLTAANYGALSRLGDSNAKALSIAALSNFRTLSSTSKNAQWSWKKEQRGKFPLRAFPGERPSESAVTAWRSDYQGHYRDNLAEAGLGSIWESDPTDDGDLVDDNNSANDDDDSIE